MKLKEKLTSWHDWSCMGKGKEKDIVQLEVGYVSGVD